MAFPKIDGYVVTEKLGCGSYSTVYKAYTKVGARATVAIKCIDKSRIKHSGSAVDNLITEIRLLKTLRHPNIVHMHNFTWDERNIYIIMEYCCGGDLSKYIHKYGRIPEHRVLYFLQQLASALKFLREKGVVHMDLKPHNLLLHKDSDGKYILKVADFGFAAHLDTPSPLSGVRGSPLYMAPEMLHCSRHDARVDLWSVGVIMYECLYGRAPYSSNTFKELLHKIETKAPIQIPPSPPISSGCRDLLTRLLQHDPDLRISYEEFFSHEYLDLEHMPTRENYEKAVNLMKRAIELDCCGQLPDALSLYTDSLRYLVPAATAHRPANNSALRAKIHRYMERAEEIKQYLSNGDSNSNNQTANTNNATNNPESVCNPSGYNPISDYNPNVNTSAVRSNSITSCCRSQMVNTTNSYDFSNLRNKCASGKETEEVDGTVEEPAVADEPLEAKDKAAPNRSNSKQRAVRRLLGRGGLTPPSLPTLNSQHNNSDTAEDSSQKGDGCRIT